jgi:hypothetical protein
MIDLGYIEFQNKFLGDRKNICFQTFIFRWHIIGRQNDISFAGFIKDDKTQTSDFWDNPDVQATTFSP